MNTADQVFRETLSAEIDRQSREKASADINALRADLAPRIEALDSNAVRSGFWDFIEAARKALAQEYRERAAGDLARSMLKISTADLSDGAPMTVKFSSAEQLSRLEEVKEPS